MSTAEKNTGRSRWLLWSARLAPLVLALFLAWTYLDSFLRPTFPGDEGRRLDEANRLIVGNSQHVWLPFLQLHIHVLYLLGAPPWAFLLIPYAYTVLSLFLLAALCRAAVPGNGGLIAGAVLPIGFAGSTFHWLRPRLYQEAIVVPVFLALVYIHYFAPQRRKLFFVLAIVGMLTREFFWIWAVVFVVLHWREHRGDRWWRAGALAVGAIVPLWLLVTHQSPLLRRDVSAGSKPAAAMIPAT